MPQRSSYAPGTPSWVDLGTADLDAAIDFYTSLFGWEADRTTDPAAGGYTMFRSAGAAVAGAGPLMNPEQPSAWGTYVTVDDADKAVGLARDAGASILVEPMDVLDVGRMAVLIDPTGAVISVWQPRAHIGAELVNEPVSLCWNELSTRDVDGAKAFYEQVFGWTYNTADMGDMQYTEVQVDGATIAGMMAMPPQMPDAVPSYWLAYFAVADTDAVVAAATELGGSVVAPPMDIPPGRMAVLSDPHGATFAVLALNQPAG